MEGGIQPEGGVDGGARTVIASPPTENSAGQEGTAALDSLAQRVGQLQSEQAQASQQSETKVGNETDVLTPTPEGTALAEEQQGSSVSAEATKPEETTSQEIEAKAPVSETPKVPGKVAGDPEFRQKWGELYSQAKQQGGDVDVAQIDRKALSEYYNDWAKTQVEQGIGDEIRNDPLYQQKLGEAMVAAQQKGEALDQNKLSQEALSKYKQEKDLQEEKTEGSQAEQLTANEQRLAQLEERVNGLSLENEKLSSELVQVVSSMADILPAIKLLLENAHIQEADPKKKETLLQLIAKLAAVMALSMFLEAGQKVVK